MNMDNKLKKSDYVEGCEHYGQHIAYIRGWINEVEYDDNNNLVYCSIKCDDNYNGYRGNNLIIDSNYPIRKVEYEKDWYGNINRFERGRSYFYRVGLDKKFLLDKDVIRFWDIDGVLAVFAYGAFGINACDDGLSYHEYMKNHDPYMDAVAPEAIKEFMWKFTKLENNYVVSQIETENEMDKKRRFISQYYSEFISDDNVYFTESLDKSDIIKNILDTKYKSLNTRHCLIDDNVKVLSKVQSKGITGIHISSFLTLMSLSERADYAEIED